MYDLLKALIWNAYKSVSKKSNSHWIVDLITGLHSPEQQIEESLKYFSCAKMIAGYSLLIFSEVVKFSGEGWEHITEPVVNLGLVLTDIGGFRSGTNEPIFPFLRKLT